VSLTLVPAGVVRWRGEGKILPQGYTNRTENQDAPLYVLEWRQAPADRGYWGLSLWHTGVFGGGEFARESLPDVRPGTGGLYQRNLLNVGFTNFFATRYHPVADGPLTAEFSLSVVREIFKRKAFEVLQGSTGPLVSAGTLDDVNEISAEGDRVRPLRRARRAAVRSLARGRPLLRSVLSTPIPTPRPGRFSRPKPAWAGGRPRPRPWKSAACTSGGSPWGRATAACPCPAPTAPSSLTTGSPPSYGGLYVRVTVRFDPRP
jgi:hypothetical protein